jgi:hypothetical protein
MPIYEVSRHIDKKYKSEYWDLSEEDASVFRLSSIVLNKVYYQEVTGDYSSDLSQHWNVLVEKPDEPRGFVAGYNLIKKETSSPEALKMEFNKRFEDYFTKVKKET